MTITGTIFDIKKFAIRDGPGIRTTAFFKGCPLDCPWCHNPEGKNPDVENLIVNRTSSSGSSSTSTTETIGREITLDELMAEIVKDLIFYDQSGGGVTFSGGEPMMQLEFLAASLCACRDYGIHTAVDTSGCARWEDFERICDLTDLFLYDLKIVDNEEHVEYTGHSNEPILENLVRLAQRGCRVEPRIPLIPGITDTDANLESIADFLHGVKNISEMVLLPYNRLAEDKLRRFNMKLKLPALETQTNEELDRKAGILRSRGYTVRFGG